MFRMKIIIPALAILMVSGCDNKPSDTDIDIGPAAALPAAEDATASQTTAGATDLVPIPAGEGGVDRVIESCNVEQINGQAFAGSPLQVSKDSPVTITGWVVDETPTSSVELRLVRESDASTYKMAVITDVARDDVASAFDADPAMVKPGFNVTFDARELQPGDYHIQIVVPSTENGSAVCDNGRVISLAD